MFIKCYFNLSSSKVEKLEMNIPSYSLLEFNEFGVSAFIARTFLFRGPDILNHFDIFVRCRRKGNVSFLQTRALPQCFGFKFLPQDGFVRR